MAHGLFIEPFYDGSHRQFADGLKRHSSHEIALLTLPGGEWRRRMRRGAQELAAAAADVPGRFDFIVATDMLDLPAFLALTRPRFSSTPVLFYLHENQFTYPRLRGTKLNSWFGQINYLSALAADAIAFNSEFHRRDFLGALRTLDGQPNNWLVPEAIETIKARSGVLPVGVALEWLDACRTERPTDGPPIVLWNHRWEFDKAPDVFARTVERLAAEGVPFRLAIAGEPGRNPHPALPRLRESLGDRIVHFGFAERREDFARLLWRSSVIVSTTRHEFFGSGMVEALYCECLPVAPARFNYPDLVPEALHDECLYDTEEECADKLRRMLSAGVLSRWREQGRQSAARFSWPAVAQKWDGAIAQLVENRPPARALRNAGDAWP